MIDIDADRLHTSRGHTLALAVADTRLLVSQWTARKHTLSLARSPTLSRSPAPPQLNSNSIAAFPGKKSQEARPLSVLT